MFLMITMFQIETMFLKKGRFLSQILKQNVFKTIEYILCCNDQLNDDENKMPIT